MLPTNMPKMWKQNDKRSIVFAILKKIVHAKDKILQTLFTYKGARYLNGKQGRQGIRKN
jgi:hypothetical protein